MNTTNVETNDTRDAASTSDDHLFHIGQSSKARGDDTEQQAIPHGGTGQLALIKSVPTRDATSGANILVNDGQTITAQASVREFGIVLEGHGEFSKTRHRRDSREKGRPGGRKLRDGTRFLRAAGPNTAYRAGKSLQAFQVGAIVTEAFKLCFGRHRTRPL